MPRRLFVLKLSGSLFSSTEFWKVRDTILDSLHKKKQLRIVLVSGGGQTAREYISAGRKLGLDQAALDEIGIEASRLNARLLCEALRPMSSTKIPSTLAQVAEQSVIYERLGEPRILVCGGFSPGQSTNAVAALIAERLGADYLINATDVDGVYDKDPRQFKKAVKLDQVTARRLSEILQGESMEAGGYDLMDPVALKLISRSRIPTRIVNCTPAVIRALLLGGGKDLGTRLVF